MKAIDPVGLKGFHGFFVLLTINTEKGGAEMIAVFFVVVLMSFVTSVYAQESLKEIEVISSPIIEENKVTDFGNQISIVTDRQIESMNALDLPNALRRVPGVTISRYNIVGSYGGAQGGAIFIRGMGAERPGSSIQITTDGKPIFQGIFSHPLMDLISIDNIDKIEVYKGAQPVFLGNMSNGSVQITTKRMTQEGFDTKAGIDYGSYNTQNTYLRHGGKKGAFDYYVIGSYKKSDGHRDNADGELQNLSARIGYELSKNWDVTFSIGHTDNWAQDPGIEGAPKPPITPRFTSRNTVYDLTVSNNFNMAKGYIKLFYDDGHVRWRQYDTSAKQVYNSNSDWGNRGIRIQETMNLFSRSELIVGYDYFKWGGEFEEVRPTGTKSLGTTYLDTSAPYVAVKHTFGSDFRITPSAGLRYNINKYFDDNIGWQTGLVMEYKDTKVFAQYAKGYNLPGVFTAVNYELFWGRKDSWKNLNPEGIDHFEIGLSQIINQYLKGDVSLFWDKVKDSLRFQSPPPRFENKGNYKTNGVELTVTLLPTKDLEIFLGGTLLNKSDDNIPYAPKQSLTFGLTYQFLERFTFNADNQYVASRYVFNPRYPTATPAQVSAYNVLNAKLSYRLTPKESKFQSNIYISGDNLLDRKYEFLKGYPAPPMTIMAGLRMSI